LGHKTTGLTIITDRGVVERSKKDGLLSNQIQSVNYDKNQLWIGTDQGVNKMVFSPEFTIVGLESYNERSGLLNAEIQQNAVLITGEYVWVGSSSGLSRLQKTSDNRPNIKPVLEL